MGGVSFQWVRSEDQDPENEKYNIEIFLWDCEEYVQI